MKPTQWRGYFAEQYIDKENESFICARESILKNFKIRAIVLMGNKTFGATGTNTVVLFLEKYNEPPKKPI